MFSPLTPLLVSVQPVRYDLVYTLVQDTDFLVVHSLVDGEDGEHLSEEGVYCLGDLKVGRLHAERETPRHLVHVL